MLLQGLAWSHVSLFHLLIHFILYHHRNHQTHLFQSLFSLTTLNPVELIRLSTCRNIYRSFMKWQEEGKWTILSGENYSKRISKGITDFMFFDSTLINGFFSAYTISLCFSIFHIASKSNSNGQYRQLKT